MTSEQAAGYAVPADNARLEALATRLRERNFEVLVVADADGAKAAALAFVPEGAEVHSGKSKTLEDAGIFGELMQSAGTTSSGHACIRWTTKPRLARSAS
jgi:hypothetical protein